MKRTIAALALSCTLLSGCASNSGAYEVSPGTYRITTSAITSFGGQATAKGAAYKTAAAECAKRGKKLNVTNEGGNAQFSGATVDITFQCL